MRKRAIVVMAVVFVAAGIAWASIVKTAVSGYIVAASGTAEKQWLDEDGVFHTRGYVGEETMVGDLAGTLYATGNMNLDLATGDGYQGGKLRFVGTWKGVQGTFEGSWGGQITGFYFSGKWVTKGSGNFAGYHLKVDNYGWLTPPGSPFIPQVYEGHVIELP